MLSILAILFIRGPATNQPMGAGSAESELFEAEGAAIDQTAKLAPRSQAALRGGSFGRRLEVRVLVMLVGDGM